MESLRWPTRLTRRAFDIFGPVARGCELKGCDSKPWCHYTTGQVIPTSKGLAPMHLNVSLCLSLLLSLSLQGCDLPTAGRTSASSSEAGFDAIGTYFRPIQDASDGPTQLVYVPVYSRLNTSSTSSWEMATTLSIRNTDLDQSLTVYEIDYFDTAGNLLEQYLQTPHELDPLTTVTLTLPRTDTRGGSGANFLVRWGGDANINRPIVEAVTTGTQGTSGFSFIRSGQEVVE